MTIKFADRLSDILARRPRVAAALEDISATRARMRETLVELRKAKGLTQRQLAEIAGWKQPFVARLESSAQSSEVVSIPSVIQYANACDVHVGLVFFSKEGAIQSIVPLNESGAKFSGISNAGEDEQDTQSSHNTMRQAVR